jgi:2-methylisocitrate lyase-like PEP mutase family enzyme
MIDPNDRREHFLSLHRRGEPLLLPNPWDVGTAKLFATLGFRALATTSSGSAAVRGRLDGELTRDEALAHAGEIAAATALPITADLEHGFADEPEGVAETVRLAAEVGVAGCSIEDYVGGSGARVYEPGLAAERVAAAAEAAHAGPHELVLTARAENHLRGRQDLDDTLRRLQSFQEAGADVVYAPGLVELDDIERITTGVDVPVNVLISPGGPTVAQLASVGVARISVGGAFSLVALGAVTNAARELLAGGSLGFWDVVAVGRKLRQDAFGSS